MYFFISMNLILYSIIFIFLSLLFMIMKLNLLIEWTFFNFLNLNMKFIIYMDWMSNMFLMTVMMISSSIIMYTMEYMNSEINMNRFMILILTFIISMMFLIICPNMLTILLGWDGLGISSYCLIIYYQNMKSINSGMITILLNRIGDICIIMLIILFMNFNSMNFMFFKKKMNFILSLLILMCAITKSAQIPFSSWLPMAMAAPTPVSSLVHSSTLVTAGIYLLIRFNKILNNNLMFFMMYLSMFTMIMSSLNAIYEYDFKKIIALSTLSQLALMMFILSFNLYKLSFFHLISHAMFKSLLFLCSGIMIHNSFNNQDIRFMTMYSFNMNLTKIIFNIASLSLCGLPFLSGFYSKDLIIEIFNMKKNNFISFFILYSSTFLTIMYSMRLMFFTSFNYPKLNYFYKYKMNNLMIKSIIILMIMSIIFSSMINWMMFLNLNIIFLDKINKLLIYLNFILMYKILMFFMKMKIIFKKKMYKLILFINSSLLLNYIFKLINLKMLKFNINYINNMDFGWNENFILLKFYLKFILFNNKFNLINIMNMMSILMIFIYIFIF